MQSQNTISYNGIPMFPKEVIKMSTCFHICLHCKLIIKMKEKILTATMICVIVPKRVSLLNSVKTTKITKLLMMKSIIGLRVLPGVRNTLKKKTERML